MACLGLHCRSLIRPSSGWPSKLKVRGFNLPLDTHGVWSHWKWSRQSRHWCQRSFASQRALGRLKLSLVLFGLCFFGGLEAGRCTDHDAWCWSSTMFQRFCRQMCSSWSKPLFWDNMHILYSLAGARLAQSSCGRGLEPYRLQPLGCPLTMVVDCTCTGPLLHGQGPYILLPDGVQRHWLQCQMPMALSLPVLQAILVVLMALRARISSTWAGSGSINWTQMRSPLCRRSSVAFVFSQWLHIMEGEHRMPNQPLFEVGPSNGVENGWRFVNSWNSRWWLQLFFLCSSRNLGFHDPIWLALIFFEMGWLKPPPRT